MGISKSLSFGSGGSVRDKAISHSCTAFALFPHSFLGQIDAVSLLAVGLYINVLKCLSGPLLSVRYRVEY